MKALLFAHNDVTNTKTPFMSLWILLLTVAVMSLSLSTAQATGDMSLVRLRGADGASGTAVVVDRKGPDRFLLVTFNLQPETYYTVFLTENQTPGFLPAQFIGEFKTNKKGFGSLSLHAEIVNAFASANQSLADDQGVAAVQGAGALANGANTIPLNWIRVYLAEGGGNVFGPSENQFGGGIALTSEHPLP